MLMDQKKLDAVKRVLKAATETQAVDAALDEIAFRHGLIEGLRALRRAGGLTEQRTERLEHFSTISASVPCQMSGLSPDARSYWLPRLMNTTHIGMQ